MGDEKQRVLLSERDHREEELGRTSTNCSFVWGTGPVGKGILRVHVWCLLILSPSLYMMIFFADFTIVAIIIIWHCHPITADMVQSSLIEAADGRESCSAASWLTPANGSAIAGGQGATRDTITGPLLLPLLKSPAHSYGLQGLQLLQPDLPTCVTPFRSQGCPLVTSCFAQVASSSI